MITAFVTNEAYRIRMDRKDVSVPALTGLVAARNDTAAFQVVVQSDHQYSVTAGRNEWFSTKSRLRGTHERIRVAVKAPFEAKVYLEGLMTDQDDVEKADVLLTQDVLESRANLPSALWVDLSVPADAEAGEYTVTVTVYRSFYGQDETVVMTQEIPLTVSKYCLADPKDWKFYLNLWQHLSSVARHHDVKLWSDEHFAVLKEYVASIAALGQKSVTLCAGEIPWGGQSCSADREHGGNLYEYSIIGITKKADGTFAYDYSKMQRYIDLCTEAGITGDIEIFGLVNVWQKLIPTPLCDDYPENIVLRYLDEADGCLKYLRKREEILAYVKALETYFIETEQIGRVRIGADEPADVDRYRASLALLREVVPAFQCSTAINHAEFIEEFGEIIDTAAPYLGCVTAEYDRLIAHKGIEGKKILWYVCGYHHAPNNCISNPLTDNRVIGPMTAYLKLDGFLRWNYCLYPDHPRDDIRYSAFGTGDVNFVYPAANGKVLLSLRYKNLQRGIADYELLRALQGIDPDAADEALKGILRFDDLADLARKRSAVGGDVDFMRDDAPFSCDWNDYNEMKKNVLARLSK